MSEVNNTVGVPLRITSWVTSPRVAVAILGRAELARRLGITRRKLARVLGTTEREDARRSRVVDRRLLGRHSRWSEEGADRISDQDVSDLDKLEAS